MAELTEDLWPTTAGKLCKLNICRIHLLYHFLVVVCNLCRLFVILLFFLAPLYSMRRHTVSLLHHHSHSSHRQDKPLPSHPALKKNLSSPDPSPSASTSAVSIKACVFTQRCSDISLYHNQPPSAPPIVERAGDSSDPSLFTFPCSVSLPDDSTQTPSTSPVLHLQQQQQGKHSPELNTTTVSTAAAKSTSASSSFQQLHQRHSVSPVRVIPATDASRRLSDSEIGSPPKCM